jgi:hypothetical protein
VESRGEIGEAAGNERLNALLFLKKWVEASGVSGTRKNPSKESAAHGGGAGNDAVND